MTESHFRDRACYVTTVATLVDSCLVSDTFQREPQSLRRQSEEWVEDCTNASDKKQSIVPVRDMCHFMSHDHIQLVLGKSADEACRDDDFRFRTGKRISINVIVRNNHDAVADLIPEASLTDQNTARSDR